MGKEEMLLLDSLQSENPNRDIQAELENLMDNGFTRKEALKRLTQANRQRRPRA